MTYIKKLLSVIFLISALTAFGYFGKEVFKLIKIHRGSEADRLAVLWERDLNMLIEQKKLHPAWPKIREVVLIGATKKARNWLKEIGSPVKINPKGNHRLEVLLLNWEDKGREGAIVQYNLIDLESRNMIWELGRTYVLKGSAEVSDSDKPSQEPTSVPAESSSH